MNTNFKPIGLAAAVATAAAGYAGAINAQTVAAETGLGDMAIVPYYTVNTGYSTGVNVINTSAVTQAVKIRFRRAVDSMDALDFNVVLSPQDMYTGFITGEGTDIKFVSNDNSCTAPAMPAGGFVMPSIYNSTGQAATGYIEIISMGTPDSETAAVALAAKHDSTGVPADCAGVRDNFFRGGVSMTTRGVVDSTLSVQNVTTPTGVVAMDNNWIVSPDSLKVSYFIKSDETGVEFGNNAVHIAGFMDGPAITNQQTGVFSGDLMGFDHPDLNGGSPIGGGASVGLFQGLRDILGAQSLINDWSANSTESFGVDTDWVVTLPGQYVMLNLPMYLGSLATAHLDPLEQIPCNVGDPADAVAPLPDTTCDFRDIPMTATFTVYDREEQSIIVEEGDLVISPQPPGEITIDVLDKEVNVIQWGDNPVLNAEEFISVPKPAGAKFGWSNLAAVSSAAKTQAICEYIAPAVITPLGLPAMTCSPATGDAPMVGFVAWQRAFVANPGSNYGRIVEHSRVQSAMMP